MDASRAAPCHTMRSKPVWVQGRTPSGYDPAKTHLEVRFWFDLSYDAQECINKGWE